MHLHCLVSVHLMYTNVGSPDQCNTEELEERQMILIIVLNCGRFHHKNSATQDSKVFRILTALQLLKISDHTDFIRIFAQFCSSSEPSRQNHLEKFASVPQYLMCRGAAPAKLGVPCGCRQQFWGCRQPILSQNATKMMFFIKNDVSAAARVAGCQEKLCPGCRPQRLKTVPSWLGNRFLNLGWL